MMDGKDRVAALQAALTDTVATTMRAVAACQTEIQVCKSVNQGVVATRWFCYTFS
jgi:hypothetical protein